MHMKDQTHRIEDHRVILYDRLQPIRNGGPLQSTNSIFKLNDEVKSKRFFIKKTKKYMFG